VSEPGRFHGLGDQVLIRQAREGNRSALEALVEKHQGVVFRFLLGILKDEDRAADAVQETFLKALGRLESFRGDSTFRTWLLAIARNEALGMIRGEGRRREDALEDAEELSDRSPSPDRMAIEGDEVRRIREAMERLPDKQRLSVSLRLFDGLSFREIAEATGSTEGAARVNYHYGIGRLREWCSDDL
jgi:RNA polymerase sigma-70 factor (ECF subfamily)